MPQPTTFTARWLFPVDGPPLENGTITIQGEHIVAVDQAGTRSADVDLGNVAILPGFVNTHTHLDLSDALGQCPPGSDFTAWLRAVVAHRHRQSPEAVANAIDIGLSQCLHYGTTLVGDIVSGGASWDWLNRAPIRAVAFFEMLGLTRERARETLQGARAWLEHHPDTDTCRAGLSPHAPYSVRASHWRDLEGEVLSPYARQGRLVPVAMHVAETEAELQLLSRHEGPFVAFLKDLGAWDEAGLGDMRLFVEGLARLKRPLFIHGNYLSEDTNLGEATLVYCPRTHAAFGHKEHPFRAFQAQGCRVALGTDSLASNPDLDVLAEARFLRQRYSDIPGATLLQMATLDGAAALGWDNVTGSLAPGKSADMVVLPLPDSDANDPHSLVLESPLPISSMLFRGKLSYSTDGSSTFQATVFAGKKRTNPF
jgi:aminodeoxyfutalosine deaminase